MKDRIQDLCWQDGEQMPILHWAAHDLFLSSAEEWARVINEAVRHIFDSLQGAIKVSPILSLFSGGLFCPPNLNGDSNCPSLSGLSIMLTHPRCSPSKKEVFRWLREMPCGRIAEP